MTDIKSLGLFQEEQKFYNNPIALINILDIHKDYLYLYTKYNIQDLDQKTNILFNQMNTIEDYLYPIENQYIAKQFWRNQTIVSVEFNGINVFSIDKTINSAEEAKLIVSAIMFMEAYGVESSYDYLYSSSLENVLLIVDKYYEDIEQIGFYGNITPYPYSEILEIITTKVLILDDFINTQTEPHQCEDASLDTCNNCIVKDDCSQSKEKISTFGDITNIKEDAIWQSSIFGSGISSNLNDVIRYATNPKNFAETLANSFNE